MKTSEKIAKLSKKIELLKQEMKNCNHFWEDTKYSPYKKTPSSAMGFNGRFETPDDPIEVKRWSRECSICGHIEYTETFLGFENT